MSRQRATCGLECVRVPSPADLKCNLGAAPSSSRRRPPTFRLAQCSSEVSHSYRPAAWRIKLIWPTNNIFTLPKPATKPTSRHCSPRWYHVRSASCRSTFLQQSEARRTEVLKSQTRNVKPQLLQLSFDVEQRSIRKRKCAQQWSHGAGCRQEPGVGERGLCEASIIHKPP